MATTAARAAALQQTLAHNAALTDELCGILGKFDARMARLEEAILPVQARVRPAARRAAASCAERLPTRRASPRAHRARTRSFGA